MATSSPFLGALGGSAIGAAVVKLVLDSKAYEAQMATAKGQTEASLTSMGNTSKKFSMYATAAFAVVGAALLKFGMDSIQVAAAHEKILAQLSLQVGGTTAGFEKQAAALEKLTGYQHDEILAADTVLARLHLTSDQVQTLVPRILDFASAIGQSVPDAAATFEKALLGTARGLKVGGIAFVDTGTLAGNYAELIDLTSKASIKGSATLDTYAKKQRELQSAIKDLQEEVGTALLPVMGQLTTTLANLVQDVGPLVTAFFKGVAEDAAILTQNLNDVLGPIEKLTGFLHGTSSAADDTGISFGHVFHALQDVANPFNWNILIKGQKAWRDLHGASEGAAQGTNDAADAAARAAQKEQQLAAAHDAVVAAAKAQKEAEQALAGGLLGLIASARQVIADQKVLNELRKKGKTDGAAYHGAELQLLQDQVAETDSLRSYITTLKTSGDSQKQAIDKVYALGKASGITRGDVRSLVGEVYNLKGALDNLPSNTTTTVTTKYISQKNAIAAGGIIAGQSGFITSGPTYLVGEGNSPTFAGRGAEAVMPLNDRGIGIMAEAFSRAMARSRSGGGITVNVAGKVERPEDIQQNLDWWMRSRGV